MKTVIVIMAVLSGLVMLSTMICGFWMRSQATVDPSSISFHMGIAVLGVLLTLATIVLAISRIPAPAA